MKQGLVLLGVDLIGQLALRAVGHFVLASAAKLVDDLLTVDLHLDTSFRTLPILGPACPILGHAVQRGGRPIVVLASD